MPRLLNKIYDEQKKTKERASEASAGKAQKECRRIYGAGLASNKAVYQERTEHYQGVEERAQGASNKGKHVRKRVEATPY